MRYWRDYECTDCGSEFSVGWSDNQSANTIHDPFCPNCGKDTHTKRKGIKIGRSEDNKNEEV